MFGSGKASPTLPAIFLLGLVAGLLILARGPALLSTAVANSGALALNQTVAQLGNEMATVISGSAEARFRLALSLDPDNARAQRGLGLALNGRGQTAAASSSWQANEDMGHELLLWGHQAFHDADFSQALVWYEQAAEMNPSLSDPWYFAGLTQENMAAPALASAAYLTGLTKPSSDSIGDSDFYFRLGQIAAAAPDPDWRTAVTYYEQALAAAAYADPFTRVRTLFGQGWALRRLGLPGEAQQVFETLVAEQPDHYWGLVQLGILNREHAGDPDRAETLLLQAAGISPGEKQAYWQLGRLYEEQGDLEQAQAMLNRVLAIDPDDSQALEKLRQMTQ